MLHLLAFPQHRSDLLELLSQCLVEGDDVVLLDEGLVWLQHDEALEMLRAAGAYLSFLDAGLAGARAEVRVAQINHLHLIKLSTQHQASSAWYP